METRARSKRSAHQLVRGHSDAIRIVPLQHPQAAAPSSAPQLTYRNGPLLTAVEVFTVFWGAAWNSAPLNATMQSMNEFFDFVLTSALMDQLGEYSVPSAQIGHGTRTGTTVMTAALKSSINDAAIQQELETQIGAGSGFPTAGANTLYFLFMPPGVRVVQGGASSCQAFCGYHNDINGQIFYAVMPYPGCSGCTGGLQPLDALTSTSSHELCEAITDPIPGQGWYDDANGEIGDICAWKTKQLGNYTVQLEWSNKANNCI
jgi:hypothetical protein